jgi:hypothetical protein
MGRIEIPRRPGHELDTDADDCLAYVSWGPTSRKAKPRHEQSTRDLNTDETRSRNPEPFVPSVNYSWDT